MEPASSTNTSPESQADDKADTDSDINLGFQSDIGSVIDLDHEPDIDSDAPEVYTGLAVLKALLIIAFGVFISHPLMAWLFARINGHHLAPLNVQTFAQTLQSVQSVPSAEVVAPLLPVTGPVPFQGRLANFPEIVDLLNLEVAGGLPVIPSPDQHYWDPNGWQLEPAADRAAMARNLFKETVRARAHAGNLAQVCAFPAAPVSSWQEVITVVQDNRHQPLIVIPLLKFPSGPYYVILVSTGDSPQFGPCVIAFDSAWVWPAEKHSENNYRKRLRQVAEYGLEHTESTVHRFLSVARPADEIYWNRCVKVYLAACILAPEIIETNGAVLRGAVMGSAQLLTAQQQHALTTGSYLDIPGLD